ncbi:hypothetical protein J1614_005314 [Plenodomus biglobosus]|nr:hypothetical protein J1614_005314 [Plenodomus biglobosus]
MFRLVDIYKVCPSSSFLIPRHLILDSTSLRDCALSDTTKSTQSHLACCTPPEGTRRHDTTDSMTPISKDSQLVVVAKNLTTGIKPVAEPKSNLECAEVSADHCSTENVARGLGETCEIKPTPEIGSSDGGLEEKATTQVNTGSSSLTVLEENTLRPEHSITASKDVSRDGDLIGDRNKVLETDTALDPSEVQAPSINIETAIFEAEQAVDSGIKPGDIKVLDKQVKLAIGEDNAKSTEPISGNLAVPNLASGGTTDSAQQREPLTPRKEEVQDEAKDNAERKLKPKAEDTPPLRDRSVTPSRVPKAPIETSAISSGNESVPPHLRPSAHRAAQPSYGLHSSRHSDFTAVSPRSQRKETFEPPRFPRPHQAHLQHSRYDSGDSEQVARLHAQILSLKNVLEAERKTSANMRKTIEEEKQRKSDAAFSSLLTTLLHAQEEALTSNARAESMKRDLEARVKKIEQLEVYLAEGQKQLFWKLEQEGIRSMSVVDRESIKREAELAVNRRLAEAHGKLQMRSERLRLRESSQAIREQQYEISIRAALEAEVREAAQPFADVDEIAELEYNRGFAAGKEAAKKITPVIELKDNFVDGYAAYHRVQTALDNFRHGRIAQNHPALAFLFDAGHQDNLIARGMQMGRMKAVTSTTTGVQNGVARGTVVNEGQHNPTSGQPSRFPSQQAPSTKSSNIYEPPYTCTTQINILDSPSKPLPPPNHKPQERAQKLPPPRQTLAAELRGEIPMRNGMYILANGSAAREPEPKPVVKTGRFADVGPDLLDL